MSLVELLVTLPPDRTPFIWGPPGIGKSALVREAADLLDVPCVTLLGTQIAPDNVAFQVTGYHDTGLRDRSGAVVPEAELIGEGDAWVLTAGRLIKGRWSRPGEDRITAYTVPSGEPIRLTPGRTWVELVPLGNLSSL